MGDTRQRCYADLSRLMLELSTCICEDTCVSSATEAVTLHSELMLTNCQITKNATSSEDKKVDKKMEKKEEI